MLAVELKKSNLAKGYWALLHLINAAFIFYVSWLLWQHDFPTGAVACATIAVATTLVLSYRERSKTLNGHFLISNPDNTECLALLTFTNSQVQPATQQTLPIKHYQSFASTVLMLHLLNLNNKAVVVFCWRDQMSSERWHQLHAALRQYSIDTRH